MHYQDQTHTVRCHTPLTNSPQSLSLKTFVWVVVLTFYLPNENGNLPNPPALIKKKTASWFHFLCKDVTVERRKGMKPRIADPRGTQYSHGDWLWIRSSIFLKWNDCDDRDMATATLIVFSASPELRARFERLCMNPDWTVALVDPFSLYVIVLDELWLQADGIMNKVAEVFSSMETVCTHIFHPHTNTPLSSSLLQIA